MKTVKVSIQDENTLVLQENGQKGDLIDLKSIHETDIDKSTIAGVVKSIKQDAFEEALAKERQNIEREKALEAKLNEQQLLEKSKADLAMTEQKVAALNAKLEAFASQTETEKKLAVTEAVSALEKERDSLANKLTNKDTEKQLLEASLKREFESELKTKDEVIAFYKDHKAKLSTKMVGETLEQHCEIEFNKLRATAFPNAYFEKDNDASSGSKGDYIYRETDEAGNEIISIMFEMKNEGDETATKKKNEDFLKELDKDRRQKNCEYAVLVSLLESDNELYNTGIVDMSHKHNKMYVIRPQFFIPMITLLRNSAINSMKYKSELALVKAQHVDITNFEENLENAKNAFARNYDLAGKKFVAAIEGIDKTIKQLEKTKEALLSSENNFRLANDKLQQTTVKRLTKGSPTMAEKFERLPTNQAD